MIFGRRKKVMASDADTEKPRSFPLILPNGDSVDMEIFAGCDYKISEYMKKYAFFAQNPSKTCLNNLDATGAKSLPTWNSNAKPAEMLCTILSQLLSEIKKLYPYSVSADKMVLLQNSNEICTILKKTVKLRNVPLSLLKTVEDTTCFWINLTNLMFLHALIFKPNESTESFHSMGWTARQTYFDSVGYIIGKFGFISLYELHCFFLKYPSISTSSVLLSLKLKSDTRIPFAIAQPFAVSPKIDTVHPNNLDEYLESCEKEYLTVCSALNEGVPLSLSLPLLLKIEMAYYDDHQLLPYTFQHHPKILEKLNLLSVGTGNIGPQQMMQTGIFLVTDTEVLVNFSYSNLELKSLHRVPFKFCVHHLSFFHCCMDLMLTIKMNMFENRYHKFLDKNVEETEKELDIFDIYKEIVLFAGHLMEEEFDSDDCPEEMRCVNNVLLFFVGENADLKADKHNQFENIFKILRISIEQKQEFSYSFAKIRVCEKILISYPELRKQYASWYDLFTEKPACKVLSLLLNRENTELAVEFVDAQFLCSPFYNFGTEVFAVYLSQLCTDGEIVLLKENILRIEEKALIEMLDILISQQCQIVKLKILVNCILQHFQLSKFGKTKFYGLWMSFRMLAVVSEFEQYLFYDIVHHPDLIVEQIVINKCSNIFKRVMNISRKPLVVDPIAEKLENEFRKAVDSIIILYAEKALFFTKDLSLKDESDKPIRKFIPPKKIPTIAEWMPDEKAPNCTLCNRKFTVFTRRHHCRRCGRVVCHFCSNHKLEIFKFELKVRVCDECYDFEKPLEIVENDILTPGSHSQTKIIWRLSGDSESDRSIRRQITFENGPDIVFCMSLVEQHTPNDNIARFLYVKAEEMTKILRHRLIYSANFDYDHVAMCARSLTYASKLLYSSLNDIRAVQRCEEMANEIELLKLCSLVSYVPKDPNKPMRDIEQWSLIKDRLTNAGEWIKALEIALKIGADTKSIWFLWGISLLKSGDWISAREKFKYSSIKTNPSALKEILETIHSSVEIGPKFEEGLHYIRLYGNKVALYQYYIQFHKFNEAVEIAFHNDISPELFSDTVILPAIKNNSLESLLQLMDQLDPSHEYWREHVRHFYKFLQNESDVDILWKLVKFIDDYFYMSMCCIRCFPRGCTSYKELQNNIELLTQAVEYMIMFRDQPEEKRVVKNVSRKRIDALLEEITMQIEINSIIMRTESLATQKYENTPTLFNIKKTGHQLISLLFKAINDVDKAYLLTIEQYALFDVGLTALEVFQRNFRVINQSMHMEKYSLDCEACYCQAIFGLTQHNRVADANKLISSVMKWMMRNVKLKENESHIPILDALLIHAVRGKPEYPMAFASRISDVNKKINVLIETNQLKDAFRFVIQLDSPESYLKQLESIAESRKLMWLKTIISGWFVDFRDKNNKTFDGG